MSSSPARLLCPLPGGVAGASVLQIQSAKCLGPLSILLTRSHAPCLASHALCSLGGSPEGVFLWHWRAWGQLSPRLLYVLNTHVILPRTTQVGAGTQPGGREADLGWGGGNSLTPPAPTDPATAAAPTWASPPVQPHRGVAVGQQRRGSARMLPVKVSARRDAERGSSLESSQHIKPLMGLMISGAPRGKLD